jgi:predicted GNAT family acetyltransferase
MNLNLIDIDKNHWTTEWIPISYQHIISKSKLKKSKTVYWGNVNIQLNAIARLYYINSKTIEIGDVWLNPIYHGKKYNDNINYSVEFLLRVIKKVKTTLPSCKNITLIVSEDNKKAFKLYQKLGFEIIQKNLKVEKLKINNGIKMILKI